MYRIIAGFAFIVINITISTNGQVVDLFPDFLGYILIYSGLKKMWNLRIDKAWDKSVLRVLILLSSVQYIIDVLGLVEYILQSGNWVPIMYIIYEFITITMFGYMIYMFVDAIQYLEEIYKINLYGNRLEVACKGLLIAKGLGFLCIFAGMYIPYVVSPVVIFNVIIFVIYVLQLFVSFRKVNAFFKSEK